MKVFFKSGRYLLWVAAVGMMFGAGIVLSKLDTDNGNDDAGAGAAVFVAGLLIWLRASKKEKRFLREARRNTPVAPELPSTI